MIIVGMNTMRKRMKKHHLWLPPEESQGSFLSGRTEYNVKRQHKICFENVMIFILLYLGIF